ncbi:hypothetical protein TNCV_3731631 [Trichonephila clavipes]|nr:hypothetical protein TNCV_3731631 [Trichonephila clavipes]
MIDEDGSIGVNILLVVESRVSDTGIRCGGSDIVAAIEDVESRGLPEWQTTMWKRWPKRSGSEMTPREVFNDLCGMIFTGELRNVFASRKDFVCVEELVSTSRSPDRNLLTDFGSPTYSLQSFMYRKW